MAPRFNDEDSKLIADLHKLSAQNPKLVKSSTYAAPAAPSTLIRSWKMNEFKYYIIPSPFPTLARGLFTMELPTDETGTDPKYRIVVRGYDKFFNIGEVPWTKWSSLEARTAAPYTLTLKSNGCIIFIGALSPSQLVITSKHSLGPGADAEKSHAVNGQRWLQKHLATKGKTEEQFAATLWDKNWTAIAELCDDSFEEHVLGYPPEQTGLHLHGINESTKLFKTLPPATVDAFAEEWGFIITKSIVMNSIPEVKTFTDEIAKTGKWNGEAIEGFVVRTHVVEPPPGEGNQSASPYAPGSTFFFKVKFDEPYMMYRDWREVTKKLLATKGPLSYVKIPRNKMKRPETQVYVKWVQAEIKKDPDAFREYTRGKGIISTRERFLRWLATDDGKKRLINADISVERVVGNRSEEKEFGKTIIVPVAIPGCGKTSVGVAISYLFGFGHTQSDDVHAKKPAPIFIRNVSNMLKTHEVVIADKNNHLRQHRGQLRDLAAKFSPSVRLLAWNWVIDQPPATIHRMMGDRVLARGDNHQTLRADVVTKAHEDVLWMFLNQMEELEDNEVEASVEMSVEDTLEQAVNKAIDGCVRVLGVERPSKEKVDEALQVAMGYAPTTKTDIGKKKEKPRYFGFLPEVNLSDIVGSRLSAGNVDSSFWEHLVANDRVTKRPHATIVHKQDLLGAEDLWQHCTDFQRMESQPLFKFKLGHIVWNKRIMALTVEDIDVAGTVGVDSAKEFLSKLPQDVYERLHITVGTKNASVPPVEAGALIVDWRSGATNEDVSAIELEDVVSVGGMKGLF